MISRKIKLLLERRGKKSHRHPIEKDNGDLNSEIISAIEKSTLKCFIEDAKNDNPSE